ncbi:MAG: SRPBCC family protein [Phycisphaeraceae bacterium]
MRCIHVATRINAPLARCFDLARSVDLHVRSTANTRETAVAGVTTGLLELDQEVTWQATHFGVRQRLTSRITAFDRPRYFQDRMTQGAFKSLEHDHLFEPLPTDETQMTDILRFEAPLGPLGRLAERLVLARYLTGFLIERGRSLKQVAESEEWRAYLPGAAVT